MKKKQKNTNITSTKSIHKIR